MINTQGNYKMSKVNTVKKISATQVCIELMNALKDKPMVEVVKSMTESVVNRKGAKFSVAEATTAYRYLVKNGKAPGTIEKLTVVRAPKAPKAAKVIRGPKLEKLVNAAKSDADHIERLKAAAKRHGIHRDSMTMKDEEIAKREEAAEQEPARDDVLGMLPPEKLSMDDLKSIL